MENICIKRKIDMVADCLDELDWFLLLLWLIVVSCGLTENVSIKFKWWCVCVVCQSTFLLQINVYIKKKPQTNTYETLHQTSPRVCGSQVNNSMWRDSSFRLVGPGVWARLRPGWLCVPWLSGPPSMCLCIPGQLTLIVQETDWDTLVPSSLPPLKNTLTGCIGSPVW